MRNDFARDMDLPNGRFLWAMLQGTAVGWRVEQKVINDYAPLAVPRDKIVGLLSDAIGLWCD